MAASMSTTAAALPLPTSKRRLHRSQEALALDLLRNCTNFNHLKQIHATIIRRGLSGDHTLATKILAFCSSYNRLDYAAFVFLQIHNPPTFSWNVMVRGRTLCGQPDEALRTYNLMIIRGVSPDKFTFPFAIKACIASSQVQKGKEIHAFVVKSGFAGDMFVQHTLMDLYFKCGDSGCARKVFDKMRVRNVVSWTTLLSGLIALPDMDAARLVFDRMPVRNVVSWSAMIHGCVKDGRHEEAFELFWRMRGENVRANEFTLVSLLGACADIGSLKLGSRIHGFAIEEGFEIGPHLGTALVDMFSKCGSLGDAKGVFEKMPVKSLATWNSMITSLGVHGCGEEALALFAEMQREKVQPDAITFVGVLCACINTRNVDEGVRQFRCMVERYNIAPVHEHYLCMNKLRDLAQV